jgi:hypothetical protein
LISPESALGREWAAQDRAFAAAVLGVECPSATEVTRVVDQQTGAYFARAHDKSIEEAYEEYFEAREAEDQASHDKEHSPEPPDIDPEM